MNPLEDAQLARLFRELRIDYTAPFVVRGRAAMEVELMHYGAGRDASYVLVQRPDAERAATAAGAVTIDPGNIPGTTIIYDVTAECLQGKARPFVCDLKTSGRVYAILPYQIEDIDLRLEINEFGDVRMHVAFLDARDERLQAALPFARWRTNSLGSSQEPTFWTTDRTGTYSALLNPGREFHVKPWTLSVRSLLTGRTKSVRLEKKV